MRLTSLPILVSIQVRMCVQSVFGCVCVCVCVALLWCRVVERRGQEELTSPEA